MVRETTEVGVIVERRVLDNPWVDHAWRAIAVLAGVPAAAPWTVLDETPQATRYYAGAFQLAGPWPWLTAWCGDIDITGHRRPASYYREIVFGMRSTPYIAVERPDRHGREQRRTPWSWTDAGTTRCPASWMPCSPPST